MSKLDTIFQWYPSADISGGSQMDITAFAASRVMVTLLFISAPDISSKKDTFFFVPDNFLSAFTLTPSKGGKRALTAIAVYYPPQAAQERVQPSFALDQSKGLSD